MFNEETVTKARDIEVKSDQDMERPIQVVVGSSEAPEEFKGPTGHACTSGCGNDYDCPACEHGYREDLEEVCPTCDGE